MKIVDKRFLGLAENVRAIRRNRYEMYKQTKNDALLEITETEYKFLDMLAQKIEKRTNIDCFVEIAKIYERVNKFYIDEEPYVSMNRFQFYLGCVERKLLKRKIEVSLFSSASELEEFLGDMCYYDGEKTLLKIAASVDLQDKLIKYLGENGFEVLNDTENNCKTYQTVANEKGLTRERIRQVRVNAMRGMYCKTLRHQTRRQLEDIAEVVFSAEQSELDTTFVKQK